MLARAQSKKDDNGNVMSDTQFANYLTELRINRTARLNGSRPPPPARHATKREKFQETREPAQTVQKDGSEWITGNAGRPLVPEPLSFKTGRPQRHHLGKPSIDHDKPLERSTSSSSYVELGVRKHEREEAHSLRLALEDEDAEEEKRIHEAAQDEASRLVSEHRNPSAVKKPESAYPNPDLKPNAHTRRESLEFQDSVRNTVPLQKRATANTSHDSQRAADNDDSNRQPQPRKTKSYHGLASAVARDVESSKRRVSSGSRRKSSAGKGPFANPDDKIYEEPEEGAEISTPPRILEEPEPEAAAPEPIKAQIKAEDVPEVPSHVRRNPFARVRFNQEKLARTKTAPVEVNKRFNAVEIHKNPPTQSRKPWYLANKPSIPTLREDLPKKEEEGKLQTTQEQDSSRMKDGKEIRGDDIRAATSMKRADRSPNLPQPTAVSDSPGRPIVSFQKGWKPKEIEQGEVPAVHTPLVVEAPRHAEPKEQSSEAVQAQSKTSISAAEYHAAAASKPSVNMGVLPAVAIPSISVPDDMENPSRTLAEEPIIPCIFLPGPRPDTAPVANLPSTRGLPERPVAPTVSVEPDAVAARGPFAPRHGPRVPLGRSGTQSTRPLPDPTRQPAISSRPLPHHSATAPVANQIKPHYTPSVKRTTALCAHCALPIAGRILTAAGDRFHPECFRCHQCGTNLECVAFYPEPDQKYYERIARIQQRNQGLEVAASDDMSYEEMQQLEAEDGDESMRFFCHLDYHELFSPRCKSCRTPIEGEVVVACGAEWHVGHFFCAQCGDPFDSSTPFVEREGYAWCIGCHTHRYSPKCKGCRKPITDVVVNALDAEWHGDCFCCMECGGGFDDGRYFLRGDSLDPVCIDITAPINSSADGLPVDTSTPFRRHRRKEHAYDINSSPAQSVSPDHTGRASRRYFTPALQQGRFSHLSDLTGRLLDTQSTTDTYYTAIWGSPYELLDESASRHRSFDLSSRFLSKDSPTPGLALDSEHLVHSRLVPHAPSSSTQSGRRSAPGFVDRPTASAERSAKRKDTRNWVDQGIASDFESGSPGWESARVRQISVDLDKLRTPSAISGLKLSERGARLQASPASPTLERRPRQLYNKKTRGPLRGLGEGRPDTASDLENGDADHLSQTSRDAVTAEMLASRWTAAPSEELPARQTEQPEPAEPKARSTLQDSAEPPLIGETSAPSTNDEIGKTISPVTSSMNTSSQQQLRQRIKVPWNGRSCIVAMPWQGPEAYGGSRPLAEQEVRNRLQQWEANGFETRGFDLADPVPDGQSAAQGRPVFPDPTESAKRAKSEKLRVSVPDPKAWKHYVDWLTEQKLRALGVSFGDDEPPAVTLQPSHQRGRSVSPALAASFGGPPGFSVAQRSIAGISGHGNGLHSRNMSVASPMSASFEPKGHMHRHSVFGMPAGLPQTNAPPGGFRSFSPLQQSNLSAQPASASPGMHEIYRGVSPGLQANYLNQFRPSPVPTNLQPPLQPTSNWTPPAHMRHQSLASSFAPQPSARLTPIQPSLMEVPEDEEDIVDGYMNRTPAPVEDIDHQFAVPKPNGHRHNISEVLDRDLRNLEASLEPQSGQFGQHEGNLTRPPPQQPPQRDSFSFGQGFGQFAPRPVSHGFPAVPQSQPSAFSFESMQPAAKPAMPTGHRSRLSVAAPEFRFNPTTAFQASTQPKQMAPALLPPVHEQQSTHASQQLSGNAKVEAPVSKPPTFGTPTMPSGDFSFAAPSITPGSSAFQPNKSQTGSPGQQSIFGKVQIPDGQQSARKSKAIPIVRPEKTNKEKPADVEAEDEFGRVLQSEERQKRARKEQEDGDSVPLFAERPDSPLRSASSPVKEKMGSQDLSSLVADTVRIADRQAPLEQAPEQSASANIKSTGDFGTLASMPAQRSHQRNQSSLSAFAKPFQPRMAAAEGPTEPGRSVSPVQDTAAPSLRNLDPSPMRIFSRQQEEQQDATLADPGKQTPAQDKSAHHLAGLTFEPSFDELDAVMRQLNDDDAGQTPSADSPQARPDTPQYLRPAERQQSLVQDSNDIDLPSPSSVQMHAGAEKARSISSMSEELEMLSPNVNRPAKSDDAPIEDWSDELAADEIIETQGLTSTTGWQVAKNVETLIKLHLRPIRDQLASVQRAMDTSASNRRGRPRTSSGIDSDADDEDDIVDSKFLPRPLSRGKDRRLDVIRATVLEALNTHSSRPQPVESPDIYSALADLNAMVARIAAQSLDTESVKSVVAEALYTHGKAIVHVPVGEVRDVVQSQQLSELQARYEETLAKSMEETSQRRAAEQSEIETRRSLRLAEEELEILRATMSDNDNKLQARTRECNELRGRLEDVRDDKRELQKQIRDFETETSALAATLDEYRTSSNKWRKEIDDAELEKKTLLQTISDLNAQLADGLNVRDNMREKLEKIHRDMAVAAEQIASQKATWSSRNEELHKKQAVLQARSDAEAQLRTGLEIEIQRLRSQVSEGAAAKMSLESAYKSNVLLEETVAELKDELSESLTANSHIQREIQDARENSRIEVQRAQLMMQAGIDNASNQADAMCAGLASKLAIATSELDNMRGLVEATKARHEILAQEEADLRRDTLHKVNEASSAALDDLRKRHEEDIQYIKTQRDRAVADVKQDQARAEFFWQERLGLSDARCGHLQERVTHLEERLEIAKSAAQAAVSAAQAAKAVPETSMPLRGSDKISPQALRESILVLQEQLQERETRIERLQQQITKLDSEAPTKLKEREIEINWLRELLSNRGDELSELIETLSKSDYDREYVRDAAIRIRANLQMEQAEKERWIQAGSSLKGQALAGLTNFASPRAVQLAAAFGNWRSKGVEALASPRPVSAAHPRQSTATPSKPQPISPSFLNGLMTPPASNLRRTPSPHSPHTATPSSSAPRPRSAQGSYAQSRSRPASAKTVISTLRDQSPATPSLSFRRQSYDADAELGAVDTQIAADDEEMASMPPSPASPSIVVHGHRSLADELEPIG
ncbi:hypothetical protein MBLNU457_5617t2 [Dothideomycetes sp. NU457]